MAGLTATYLNASQFSVVGDKSSEFIDGRRVRCDCGVDGYKYGTVEDSTSASGITIVTLTTTSDNLTTNLVSVEYGIVSAGTSGSVPDHNHDESEGSGGRLGSRDKVIFVTKDGNDATGTGTEHNPFLTIEAAIASITDNSVTNGYTISVSPGIYDENPFTTKKYVNIIADGSLYSTTIRAIDSTSDLVTYLGHAVIDGFIFAGPSATQLNASLINITSTGGNLSNLGFQNALVCINVTSGLNILDNMTTVPFPGTSIGTFIKSTATGFTLVRNPYITPGSVVSTGFYTSGVGVQMQLTSAICQSTSVVNGIHADNGSFMAAFGLIVSYGTTALRVGNASTINVGTPFVGDDVTNHVVVEDLDSIVSMQNGRLDREKMSFPVGYDKELLASFQFSAYSTIYNMGNTSFGRAENGSVVSLGEGRPYTRGMNILTTDNTAGDTTEGGNIIDVSTIAATDSTDTFSFQGVEAGHTILIGSERERSADLLKVLGLAVSQKVAAIENTPRSIILEYWNGTSWQLNRLLTVSDEDNHAYANAIFIRANSEEIIQIRPYQDIQKKTINGKNLYWIRFRITNDLVQAPTFTRFQLEPSITRFNKQGIPIFISWSKFRQNIYTPNNYGFVGNVSSSQAAVGTGGDPYGWNHRVTNSTLNADNDALHLQLSIPVGLCTACPMNVRFNYRTADPGVSSDGTMTISFLPVSVKGVTVADESGGTEPIPRSGALTELITANQAQTSTHSMDLTTTDKILAVTSNNFNVDDYYEGDYIFIQLKLDDAGDWGKGIIIYGVEVYGVKWRLGGRVDHGYFV